MSKFEDAVKASYEEWEKKIDKGFQEALARGEIPDESPEQLTAKAREIWRKAHQAK